MTEPNNADRAERARQTLDFFKELVGGDDYQTTMGDLLADLKHLAKQETESGGEPLDFDEAVRSAGFHFEAELQEETEDLAEQDPS